jgi:hypothetical protein
MFGQLFGRLLRPHHGAIDVRNRALEMAMDWDGDWHSPLAPRLRREMPRAADDEIERIAAECAQAMEFGHDVAFSLAGESGLASDTWEQEFRRQFCARYPWASDENVRRLLRQGLYYAFKTARPKTA